MPPHYKFDDFKDACNKGHLFVDAAWVKALVPAREIFGLNALSDLLGFIGQDGLESLDYVNTRPWHNAPPSEQPPEVLVDAYKFVANGIEGYIAFGYLPNRKQWRIKSFHPPE